MKAIQRSRAAWLAATASAAIVLAASLCPTPVSAVAGSAPAVPASGMLFGAAVYSPSGANIDTLETSLGRTLAIERVYSQWDSAQPSARVRADVAKGRVPLVSIRPQLISGTKLSWAAVASGRYDAAIRAQARGLKSVNQPVLLAFHHEADLAGGYGTAAQFRAAFRHYVSVVRATGASNISFVVVLAANSYGSSIGNWYPGDDVVDWAGADAYNFGSCRPGALAWRSFATATANFRTWGAHHDKPQLLAEWGSAEDPSVSGRKARWITDAGAEMRSWKNLHAASYFDEKGSCDWRLSTSTSASAALRALARSTFANPVPSARLTLSTLTGKSAKWVASASTGSAHTTGTGISSWSFSAGDGSGVSRGTGHPGTISHDYGSANTYSATLTVRDGTGRMSTTHTSVRTG